MFWGFGRGAMRRMRKLAHLPLAAVVAIAILFIFVVPAWAGSGNTAVFTIGKNSYVLNGNTVVMDVAPYIKEGRTFLPLRFAANAVGVADDNVLWDAATGKVTVIKGDRVVQFTIGSNVMLLNGAEVAMDVVPEVVAGRTMLPIHWLACALGVTIEWDPGSQSVVVRVPDETGRREPLPADNEQEGTLGEPAADYKSIVKEFEWRDKQGNEWTWQVPIPEELYQYYSSQLRIHELLLKEYQEQLHNLQQQVEELQRYLDFWYQQCRILPGDSYYEAWQKYQTYMSAYYEAQRNLERIWSEYLELQRLYREAEYRQMLDGYVPYVTEEKNSELVRDLAEVLAAEAPQTPRERIEFAAAFVQGAIPYVSEEGEYPRYPVETLVDGGDCEDKSILLAAILRAMGYRTALLVFDGDPGHMAVGVECPDCWGSYYQKDGVKYFYLETTDFGWSIGKVPPEYRGKSALVYVVP
ncbi:MAG: Copper amine oxidase-like domain-containing protein [Thermoanaerobacterales bacterium 50_218]|nr:MAG: Copper amine oxidase-like domain-containing protein [Thermoanaerobacterales bacterium 50_218]